MLRVITILFLIAFGGVAEARQRVQVRSSECNVTMPCDFSYDASRRAAPRLARHIHVERHVRTVERRRQTPVQVQLAPPGHVYDPSPAHTLTAPVRFIAGRLICAVNVGAALAERGIRGTGSALALSYLKWGRSAGGPVVGAVIVSARRGGGHVAIVSRVVNGVVYAWNATGGKRGWHEIVYRHHVLDYRVPS